MADKRIKDLTTAITAFRTGDVIPVDGPSGTAKMSKDSLLAVVRDGRASQKNVKELKLLVDRMASGGFNYTKGYYLDTTGGLVSSASFGISDYVEISNGDEVHWVSGTDNSNTCLCIYDEQMNFLNYYRNNATERTVTISISGAKYVRLSFSLTELGAGIDVNSVSKWTRKKYSSLTNKDSAEIEKLNLSLFGGNNYNDEVYLNANGDFVSNVNWRVSTFIKVSPNDTIVWNIGAISANVSLCLYDSDFNYISRYIANASERTITPTNDNLAWIRASVRSDNASASIQVNAVEVWKPEQVKGDMSKILDNENWLSAVQHRLDGGYNYSSGYITLDGSIVASAVWNHTDYIEAKNGDSVYVLFGVEKAEAVIALYDSEYRFLTYYRCIGTDRTITISRADAAYVRASVRADNDAVNVKINSELVWNPKAINGIDKQTQINANGIEMLSNKVVSKKNYTNNKRINNDGEEEANSYWMLSDYIPVSYGDTLYWYSGQQTADACTALYDINKNYLGRYINNDGPYREVTISNERVAYTRASVRNDKKEVCVKVNGSVVWVPHSVPGLDDYKVEPAVVRIGTYNTGMFEGRDMTTGSSEVAMAMRKAIAEANVTLLATQEDLPYFNTGLQTTSRDECFKNFKFYEQKGSAIFNYKGFCSDRNVELVRALDYSNGAYNHTYFIAGERVFNGKPVMLVCVHFDWSDNTRRQNQISQVIAFCANYENAIVLGDFNPENCINGEKQYTEGDWATMDMSDVDCTLFTNAGYSLANNGYWGKIGTFDKVVRDGYQFPCDNIAVKGNVYIHRAGVIAKDYMNDHYIFYADISVG